MKITVIPRKQWRFFSARKMGSERFLPKKWPFRVPLGDRVILLHLAPADTRFLNTNMGMTHSIAVPYTPVLSQFYRGPGSPFPSPEFKQNPVVLQQTHLILRVCIFRFDLASWELPS